MAQGLTGGSRRDCITHRYRDRSWETRAGTVEEDPEAEEGELLPRSWSRGGWPRRPGCARSAYIQGCRPDGSGAKSQVSRLWARSINGFLDTAGGRLALMLEGARPDASGRGDLRVMAGSILDA